MSISLFVALCCLDYVLSTSASIEELTCGVWLAKSTIPGAGFGMFAGKDFAKNEELLSAGDVVIPLVDMDIYHGDGLFLWDEYTWNGKELSLYLEGVLSDRLSVASPGFGSAINCFMDLTNVEEINPIQTYEVDLHRFKDPGTGGFSPYWNRTALASKPINGGQELFVSYGNSWFTGRDMDPVPLAGDLKKANSFLARYSSLANHLEGEVKGQILMDLWESFAWKNPWSDSSRILFALPKTWDETREALNITLTNLKRRHHTVSVEWLEENGECGDWITVRHSSLPQAGRGAFARKRFKAGEKISPLPMIHVPYRNILDMFKVSSDGKVDKKVKVHTQLLENYCMGHKDSTLLLCPYGTLSNHINHNQTLANVMLEWAEPSRSIHNPHWLNRTVDELHKTYHAGLAMNVVALRDISIDEEIFLDYGDEWERAWRQHLKRWTPVDGASKYLPAGQLPVTADSIKTVFELLSSPYPRGVSLYFSKAFAGPIDNWWSHWNEGTLDEYLVNEGLDFEFVEVDVLDRERDDDGYTWFRVCLIDKGQDPRHSKVVTGVPPEAFKFFDLAYDTDMFQPNAFRHDIRIPDHLFPPLWKNKILKAKLEEDVKKAEEVGFKYVDALSSLMIVVEAAFPRATVTPNATMTCSHTCSNSVIQNDHFASS